MRQRLQRVGARRGRQILCTSECRRSEGGLSNKSLFSNEIFQHKKLSNKKFCIKKTLLERALGVRLCFGSPDWPFQVGGERTVVGG